jgi:hypothetical protein
VWHGKGVVLVERRPIRRAFSFDIDGEITHESLLQWGKKSSHRPGIEPGPPAWQASILPLKTNDACIETIDFWAYK